MRLWIFSDLHLDVNRRNPFTLPQPRPDHDVVVIAGDVCEGAVLALRWIVENDLNRRPVVFVPGNHEYYLHDIQNELKAARAEAAKHKHVHVLDREELDLDGVRFLGATFWTDYRLFGDDAASDCRLAASRYLNDHDLIRNGPRSWSVGDAARDHDAGRTFLSDRLETLRGRMGIVVTHHAPSIKSIAPRYVKDVLSAAFASDCQDLAASAAFWIHGHVHHRVNYKLGACRVLANPRGYVDQREDSEFDAAFCVDISARP